MAFNSVLAPHPVKRFDNLSIYDAPEVIAGQVLTGLFTARGGVDAFFNPSRLTPTERYGVAEAIKEKVGYNPAASAIVDVATNPWTWLFLALSPEGLGTVGQAGKTIFSTAAKYSTAVSKQSGLLRALGLYSATMAAEGTPIGELGRHVSGVIRSFQARKPTADVMLAAEEWARGKGVQGLRDLTKATGKTADEVKKDLLLLQISLEGLDRSRKIKVFAGTEGEGEALKFIYKDVDVAPLGIPGLDVERQLRERGLTKMRDSIRASYEDLLKARYGQEGVEGFKPDFNKIYNNYRSLNNVLLRDGADANGIKDVLDRRMIQAIEDGRLTEKQFERMVVEHFTNPLSEHYAPRNLWQDVGATGDRVGRQTRSALRAISGDTASIARDRAVPLYSREDLESIKTFFGESPRLNELIRQSAQAEEAAINEGRRIRFLKMDPVSSYLKYLDSTARSAAWNVAKPSPELISARDEMLNMVAKEQVGPWSNDSSVRQVWNRVYEKPGKLRGIRRGSENAADILEQAYIATVDPYARKVYENYLVPAANGTGRMEHVVSMAAINTAKKGLRLMAESPVGDAIAASGENGKNFRDYLMRVAAPADMKDTQQILAGASRYLYGTHLNFNVASAVINGLQPYGPLAAYMGFGRTAKAHATAMGELFNYAQDRLERFGVSPITQTQRQQLIRKHFKYAELIGIEPDVLEHIDQAVLTSGEPFRRESFVDKLNNYGMALFSKTEWVNRATAAHAVEDLYTSRGAAINTPEFRRSVQRMSAQTQFAADPWNTPLLFATQDTEVGGPLARVSSHPLAKMFLSFPARTVLEATYTAGRLGEQESALRGAAVTFGRAMGISAIIHEATKNAGVDLDRGLYFAAATDLIPFMSGGRYSGQDSPVPIPPIVDIPISIGRSIAEGDAELFKRQLPRLVPGGVAVARALGAAPELPAPFSFLQRTYAEWGNPAPDGSVPVYRGDGTIINYQRPEELVLRSAGVDLGRYAKEGALTKFLVDNQEQMREARKRYVTRLEAGDRQGADAIKADFEQRFNMPLMVSQSQLRAFRQSRDTPRLDRVLGRMSPEIRPMYEGIVRQASISRSPPPQPAATPSGFEGFEGF